MRSINPPQAVNGCAPKQMPASDAVALREQQLLDEFEADHSSGDYLLDDALADDALAELHDYCDSLFYMLDHCLSNGPGFEKAAYMRVMRCVVDRMMTLTEQVAAKRGAQLKGEGVAHV